MAHESFEDAASAAVMNELFVNIKVDREERPDLDKIYQLAQQMLTQRSRRLAADDVPGAGRLSARSSAAPTFRRSRATACRRSPTCCAGSASSIATHREEIAQQSEALQQAFAEMSPPAAPDD